MKKTELLSTVAAVPVMPKHIGFRDALFAEIEKLGEDVTLDAYTRAVQVALVRVAIIEPLAKALGLDKEKPAGFELGGSPFYECGCNDPACILDGCKRGRTL